jgi:hypothetical protein
MKITDDDLKSAFKAQIQRGIRSSQEGCPPAEIIFSVFDVSVSPVDKEKIIDHVTTCSHCLRKFDILLDLYRQKEKAVEDIVGLLRMKDRSAAIPGKRPRILKILWSPRVQSLPFWKWAAGFLFTAVITGLFLIGLKWLLRTPELRERGRLPGQVYLISPVRGQKIETPLVFRWEATPSAEYYQLEIYDESLLPLWKSPRMGGVDYKLPPEATKIIKKNKSYFWTITAWLLDGTKKESPLEEFTLAE